MDAHDDLAFVIEFLNRAATVRGKLGPEPYRRGMRRALVALGDAAIDEAERRARPWARYRGGAVVAFTGRRRHAAAARGCAENGPGAADSVRPASEIADPEGSKRAMNHQIQG